MKAFRKVTAPSLERNKIRVRDMLAKLKAEKEAGKTATDGDEGDDASIGGDWARDVEMMDEGDDFGIGDTDSIIGDSASVCSYTSAEKPRLNIADKKKMKKLGMTNDQMRKLAARKALSSSNTSGSSRGTNASGMTVGLLEGLEMDGGAGSTFKDNKFFMSYGNEDEQQRMQEDLMQPQSGLRDLEMQSEYLTTVEQSICHPFVVTFISLRLFIRLTFNAKMCTLTSCFHVTLSQV